MTLITTLELPHSDKLIVAGKEKKKKRKKRQINRKITKRIEKK